MTFDSQLRDREPSTSVSLLESARQGDMEAWERIVRLYGPLIYTWARRSGRQPADASDVVQEVLADAAQGLVRFRSSPHGGTSFRGWLWTITRRRIIDQTRQWAKRPFSAEPRTLEAIANPVHEDSAPPTDAEDDRRGILAAALAGLHRRFSEETLRAFRRVVIDQCDPQDVATELGVSRWTVYKAKSRVLARLRTELEGLIDPP